jgi:hypothetical protein
LNFNWLLCILNGRLYLKELFDRGQVHFLDQVNLTWRHATFHHSEANLVHYLIQIGGLALFDLQYLFKLMQLSLFPLNLFSIFGLQSITNFDLQLLGDF